MLTKRISHTLVYLLRVVLLAAVVAGSFLLSHLSPAAQAQSPGNAGNDLHTTWSDATSSSHSILGPSQVQLKHTLTGNPADRFLASREEDTTPLWVPMTGTGWTDRYNHTSVALPDGSIVLMGGHVGYYKNDVWRSTDQGDTWRPMTASAEWTARSGHTSVVLADGSIILMGGGSSSGRMNDVWRSTDQGATWTQMTASAEWEGRIWFTSVALSDGSIVLMGGRNESGNFLSDVWRSTDQGATWTPMTSSAEWAARSGHTSVALTDGSIVLMGGYNESGTGTFWNDVWRSTDQGATWIPMTASAEWPGRAGHSSVVLLDDSIVLMGGYVKQVDIYLHSVYRSTDKGATWTYMGLAEWTGRHGHTSVALVDGSIVMMGGGKTTLKMNDVWRSTDQGDTWTEIALDAEWSGRSGHTSATLLDGSIVLIGGFAGGLSSLNSDVWRSTDQGATWTQMTASAEWSARTSHASVVLPDGSIVLMGGYGDSGTLNDVWRSTNQGANWTQMTDNAQWSARSGHASVALLDGSIVLMGGGSGYDLIHDVWRSTDQGATWTPMTVSAEWMARKGHASVVLPDDSIVLMGGSTSSDDYLNDVWHSMDQGATWTQMTAKAFWRTRSSHACVVLLDGSIVLMGGNAGGVYLHDVWRLESLGSITYRIYLPLTGK